MGFFDRIFNRRKKADASRDSSMNLAFVLLPEPWQPDARAIVKAFREFAQPGMKLDFEADDGDDSGDSNVVSLKLNTGETSFVALMPVPVPNREADDGFQFSLSRFRGDEELPGHEAHLLVTFHGTPDSTPVERLSRFTALIAAVTKASSAIGVYWGNAGATHGAEFFLAVAGERDPSMMMTLWSGFSMARDEDGRFSLLSTGMSQLDLPDLLIVADEESVGSAMEWMYDLLAYVAQRGEPLPEGDTLGRTEDERLPVRYVRSPVDRTKKVMQIEIA